MEKPRGKLELTHLTIQIFLKDVEQAEKQLISHLRHLVTIVKEAYASPGGTLGDARDTYGICCCNGNGGIISCFDTCQSGCPSGCRFSSNNIPCTSSTS